MYKVNMHYLLLIAGYLHFMLSSSSLTAKIPIHAPIEIQSDGGNAH